MFLQFYSLLLVIFFPSLREHAILKAENKRGYSAHNAAERNGVFPIKIRAGTFRKVKMAKQQEVSRRSCFFSCLCVAPRLTLSALGLK